MLDDLCKLCNDVADGGSELAERLWRVVAGERAASLRRPDDGNDRDGLRIQVAYLCD